MSPTCPLGHQSSTSDYCDQCGAPMTPAAAEPEEDVGSIQTMTAGSAIPSAAGELKAVGEPCPVCATPRTGSDRFCEDCGYDFATATAHAEHTPAPWEVVVSADRAHFDQMEAEGVDFPADYPPRRFVLDRDQMRLGRHRPAQPERPEIDLSGAPEDPAISHLQALLVRQQDGSYAVIDPGSTNGVMLNDAPDPIAPNVAVPLADGDRLRLGAWTKITVRGPTPARGAAPGDG